MATRQQSEVTRNASGSSPPRAKLTYPLRHADAPGLIPPTDYIETTGCWRGVGPKPKKLAKLARDLYRRGWKTHEATVGLNDDRWDVLVEDSAGKRRRISSVHLLPVAQTIMCALGTVARLMDHAHSDDDIGLGFKAAKAARSWGIKVNGARVAKARTNRVQSCGEVA
jgi:hypothetical protein